MNDADSQRKRGRIADAVRGLLDDGDAYIIRCDEGEGTQVIQGDREDELPALLSRQPDLHGQLVMLEERLDAREGCVGHVVVLVLSLVGCAALANGWWGLPAGLGSWWIYVAVIVLAQVIWHGMTQIGKGAAWRNGRDQLVEVMRATQTSRNELLSALDASGKFADIRRYLATDSELDTALR